MLPNLAKAAMGLASKSGQKKSTAVGSVPPHSHDSSKDTAAPIPPVGNITGNANQNSKIEELGKQFFHGDQFANQYASRPPVDPAMPVPPQPDPIGDQYGNMFSPFSQKKVVKRRAPEQPRLQPEKPPLPTPKHEKFHGVNMIGSVKTKNPNKGAATPQPAQPKGKAYVVNERPNPFQPGTEDRSRDTLWLDNSYKKMAGSMISEDDYEKLSKQALDKGIYERVLVEDLEDQGEIKIKI